MKQPQFFFRFTRGQRRGIVALFVIMVLMQAGYFLFTKYSTVSVAKTSEEEKQWLALQSKIDELKARKGVKKFIIYPFNPNFISDYKGYTLGMTVAEIDRLHKFRESGKFVNSARDFKKVTGVHDTLLAKISPYFKFPDWVIKKQQEQKEQYASGVTNYSKSGYTKKDFAKEDGKVVQLDINNALEEDLDKVYGIGPAFAKQILRRRAKLGAFVSMEQMHDFEAFSPEAITGLKKNFRVVGQPEVSRININTASLNQLTYFPYFNKSLAKAIITQRSMKGKILNIEELLKINDFPVDKEKIIALYLEF